LLAREDVARLSGYVRSVDGERVATDGGTFDLLPGCYLIETPSSWTRGSDQGAVVVTTGRVVFALPMRAGYMYSTDIEVEPMTGPTGFARIVANENDAAGQLVRRVAPAQSQQDIRACQQCAGDFPSCELGGERRARCGREPRC
jgi:hypothetical protein